MNFHSIQSSGKTNVLAQFHKLFGYVVVAPANFLKLVSLVYRELKRRQLLADLQTVNEMAAKYTNVTEMTFHGVLSHFQKLIDSVRGNSVLEAQYKAMKDAELARRKNAVENLPNAETISAHFNKRHRISKRYGFGH